MSWDTAGTIACLAFMAFVAALAIAYAVVSWLARRSDAATHEATNNLDPNQP